MFVYAVDPAPEEGYGWQTQGRGEVRGCGKDSSGLAPTAARKNIALNRLKGVFYRVRVHRERVIIMAPGIA